MLIYCFYWNPCEPSYDNCDAILPTPILHNRRLEQPACHRSAIPCCCCCCLNFLLHTLGRIHRRVAHTLIAYRQQVEILVDDEENGGNDDASAVEVEAGTLGTVTATAALYDPSLGISNGCDPDGCTAALTRVRRGTSVRIHHITPMTVLKLGNVPRNKPLKSSGGFAAYCRCRPFHPLLSPAVSVSVSVLH